MYRLKSPGTARALRISATGSSISLTKFRGKIVTEKTFSMTGLLGVKNRKSYSSTAFHQPASLAPFHQESLELLLPGPVKYVERSTPMITKGELEEYFYPLFRRGWELKRLEAKGSFANLNHGSPFLVRTFRFKGNRSARAFLQEILRIESEEKHHISFNLWSEKRPAVTIMTQTHSSRRFAQDIETVTTDVIEPGLTLRDIRIAVLLENLLDDANNLIGRIPDSEDLEQCRTDRAAAWQNLLTQYPFTNR